MFSENLDAYFTDFGVVATRVDTGDGSSATARVIFSPSISDSPFDGFNATGAEYGMTYQVSELPALAQGEGMIINGTQYRVRNPEVRNDGAIAVAALGKF